MRDFSRKEKEVWQACEALWEQGYELQAITGERIANQLVQLGFKRGSNTDLYRYKRSWMMDKGNDHENPTLPTPSDRISRAASALREEVLAEINEEQEAIQSRLQAELEAMQTELKQMLGHQQALETQNRDLNAQIQQQQAANNALRAQRDEINQAYLIAKEKEGLIQHQYSALEVQHQDTIKQIQAEHKASLNTLQQTLSDYQSWSEQQRHHWIVLHDKLTHENRQITQEQVELKATLKQTEKELSQTQERFKEIAESDERLKTRLESFKQEFLSKIPTQEKQQSFWGNLDSKIEGLFENQSQNLEDLKCMVESQKRFIEHLETVITQDQSEAQAG